MRDGWRQARLASGARCIDARCPERPVHGFALKPDPSRRVYRHTDLGIGGVRDRVASATVLIHVGCRSRVVSMES